MTMVMMTMMKMMMMKIFSVIQCRKTANEITLATESIKQARTIQQQMISTSETILYIALYAIANNKMELRVRVSAETTVRYVRWDRKVF